MISSIKNLWREPLLHFLLIGLALFVFYGLTNDKGSSTARQIVVTGGQVEQLTASFKRTRLRPPTEEELSGLIEGYVHDEVFYREALAMGLDQNDPLVRKHMRMKLEFLLEEMTAGDATDKELTAYLQQHPDKFSTETVISFQQVYLNPDKRKDLFGDAKKLLARLNSGTVPETVGDRTMVPSELNLASQRDIKRSFGEGFSQDVIKLSPGEWTGPIQSSYGLHLLKVSERIEGRWQELAEIRHLVEREYQAQRREEQKKLTYQALREGYDVVIEPVNTESVKTAQEATGGIIATAQAGEALE